MHVCVRLMQWIEPNGRQEAEKRTLQQRDCGDANEKKVGTVRNKYNSLVEELGSRSSRCAFARLRGRRGLKLWVVSSHALTETAKENNKDSFYYELNTLIFKIPSQQAVIVGIDANARMGPEQQKYVLRKWFYPNEQTSDNGSRLVDLCKQTNLIIASTFNRNHRRHHLK
ncbi:hypothetical protein RB195_019304 [Necator americanus]|uniref:Endonuclease/exonuclease/phosphatase domain-containing protein n=1 Tax=Necator americanus TaxID=51031 RepID=A0ABR1CDJ1_NECAM